LLIKRVKKKIIEKIKKLEVKNNEVVKVVEKMKKIRIKVLRKNEWQIEDELVLKEEKVYILKDKSLRLILYTNQPHLLFVLNNNNLI